MNDSTSPPSPASNPQGPPLASRTPAERWAQSVLARFVVERPNLSCSSVGTTPVVGAAGRHSNELLVVERPNLLCSIVGATQLHVRGEYPDELFQSAGQHLSDCMYNALTTDEPTIHFAAATLHAAMAVPPGASVIQVAVTGAIASGIAAFFNLVRAQAASLPDCTAAGRELLDQQLAAAAPAPTAPPVESSSL